VVVVLEEAGAEAAGVLDRAEPSGERRAVLQRLEVRLGVGVVVGDVRARMGPGDAEVDQQLRDRFRGHRAAAVGMDGQLALVDALGGDRVGDEVASHRSAFSDGATIHDTT
jgi:hypothetical protein